MKSNWINQLIWEIGHNCFFSYCLLILLDIVDEYLCCINVDVITTAEQIFFKLNKFMTKKQIPWEKCCSLTAYGTAVMSGCWSGVGVQVKAVALNCAMKHCTIHSKVLAVKPLSFIKKVKTKLETTLDTSMKNVIYLKCAGKKISARVFLKTMQANKL